MKLNIYFFSKTFIWFLITTLIFSMDFVPLSKTGVAAQRRRYVRNYGYILRASHSTGGGNNANRRQNRGNTYRTVRYRR